MKRLMISALVGAQILTANPAIAADLTADASPRATQFGNFLGARVRVPLGATSEKAHAGLALTATQRSGDTGTLRFSKGVEFGFSGGDKLRLSLAGRPVSQLRQGGDAAGERKLGVSTLGWIGIGVGVAAVGAVLLWVDMLNDASE